MKREGFQKLYHRGFLPNPTCQPNRTSHGQKTMQGREAKSEATRRAIACPGLDFHGPARYFCVPLVFSFSYVFCCRLSISCSRASGPHPLHRLTLPVPHKNNTYTLDTGPANGRSTPPPPQSWVGLLLW